MHETGFLPKKILVPTDFSRSAAVALRTAQDFARQVGATMYLLNVIPMLPIISNPSYSTALFPEQEFLADGRRHAHERLSASVAALEKVGIQADFSIEIGNDVVGNIMMVLDREHIDMVVLSTHGMSGWRPMIFGSIAEKVVKLVECTILLLRSPKSTA